MPHTNPLSQPTHASQQSNEDHAHSSKASPSPSAYAWVLGILLLLLVMTAGAHHLLAGPVSLITAMLIAVAKALLVASVFMHLRYEAGIIRLFALAGLCWLLILIVMTLADFTTRS